MTAKLKLDIQHILPGEFEITYKALLDLKKFGEFHPYMTKVTIKEDRSPEFIDYAIEEEIYLLGFIKNYPRYTAKVFEIEKNKQIRYESPVKKNIFLTIDFTFSKNTNGNLVVNETVEVTSNKIVGVIFLNILKKAHIKVFENLNRFLHNSVEDHKQKSKV